MGEIRYGLVTLFMWLVTQMALMPLAHAEDPAPENAANATNAATSGTQGKGASGTSDFFKDWGVGLAVLKPKAKSVSDATIVNGLVRVNSTSQNQASLLVARHFYPWRVKRECVSSEGVTSSQFWATCFGAMIGVGLGNAGSSNSNQIINFAGIGLTLGGSVNANDSVAWNFGVGVGRQFNVKVLGDGFKENEAPPPGETQVRYKTIDTNSPFVFFTLHW